MGKLWNNRSIAKAIKNDQVDIIALGRQMIADPLAAEKVLLNHFEAITNCKECANCYATIRRGVPMQCAFIQMVGARGVDLGKDNTAQLYTVLLALC